MLEEIVVMVTAPSKVSKCKRKSNRIHIACMKITKCTETFYNFNLITPLEIHTKPVLLHT